MRAISSVSVKSGGLFFKINYVPVLIINIAIIGVSKAKHALDALFLIQFTSRGVGI